MLLYKKWKKLLERLYEKTLALSAGKNAVFILAAISFIESSFFPLPPDILLIPMILARPQKAFFLAFICTVSSVLGGWFGYLIGYGLYDIIAVPLLEFYHYTEQFKSFCDLYNKWGAWLVLGAGITPFPYKIITIASGFTGLNLLTFSIASLAARGIRFFAIAVLLYFFGKKTEVFIYKNLGWLSVLFFVLLFGGFLVLKYVF